MPRFKVTKKPVTLITTKAEALADLLVCSTYRVPVAVDTEFDKEHGVVIWSYSSKRGERKVILGELLPLYKEWLEDPRIPKVYSHFKADEEEFADLGINVNKSFHADIVVMDAIHDDSSRKHGLKDQSFRWLRWKRQEYKKLFSYIPPGKKRAITLTPYQIYYEAPPDALATHSQAEWRRIFEEYSGDDAESTIACYWVHREYMEHTNYFDEYLREDRYFTKVLMRCEDRGVKLNSPKLTKVLHQVEVEMMRAEKAFRAMSGKPDINLRSTPQLKALLIDEFKWPVREDLVTATGAPSLNRFAMEWWSEEHGFTLADLKNTYTACNTLRGTFLEGLLNGVNEDGRLRSDFNQTAANTGRISSRKTTEEYEEAYTTASGEEKTRTKKRKKGGNLQNIPARAAKDPYGIRAAFEAPKAGDVTARGTIAEEDYKLLVADFSGFELCMAIMWVALKCKVSNSKMLEVMREYGTPSAVHALTAILMFKLPIPMKEWKRVKKEYPDKYTLAKNCYHPDTEALTQKGWKKIGELTKRDMVMQAEPISGGSARLSWAKPLDLQKFTPKEPVLVHLKNEGIDLRVTPDHRMLAFDKAREPVVCTPEQLPKQKGGWLNAGLLGGTGGADGDEVMLRLACALQADGSICPGGQVRFGFKKRRKVQRLTMLLTQAHVPYRKSKNTRGVTTFYITAKASECFKRFLDTGKLIPWSWLQLTPFLRATVLDEIRYWDGCERGGRAFVYVSAERRNVDVLQALATATGLKTRLVTRPNSKPEWQPLHWLTIRDKASTAQAFHMPTPRETYSGEVVCLSVPTTFVVVRDGGIPVISGNCNFNLLFGGRAKMLCRILGMDWRDDDQLAESQDYIDTWNRIYPEMRIYQKFMIRHGNKFGWVPTIGGRRANVQEGLASTDDYERMYWERKCMNTPCQGSAADIVKKSMNDIERDRLLRKWGMSLLFPVHDELVSEAPGSVAQQCLDRKVRIMKGAYRDRLPFEMDVEGMIGNNWREAKS